MADIVTTQAGTTGTPWQDLPLPDFKGQPGWEFTELRKFDLSSFPRPAGGDLSAEAERVFENPGFELRQVDAAWERLAETEQAGGAIVMPLAQAVEEHGDLVEAHLGTVVTATDDPFVARNAAEWDGGAFVYVPRNARLDRPVLLTAIQAQEGTALSWRVLVVLEEGAEAEVWEQELSAATEGLVNTVVEIVVGQNARLRFVSAQGLDERSWVFGAQRARVGRDASLDWVTLGFGAAHGKVFQNTILDGEGASGKVTGAYAVRNRQHLDFDTTQEHAAANTTSDLAFRGILADRASAVWRGMIKVDPGAQQTDAFQESRNLLVSKRAHADAIPGLEILANDVRCTHAAAIAQIDPEQVYYLRSRGLRPEQAQRLVIEGFLAELVERFEAGAVRDALAAALDHRLGVVLA